METAFRRASGYSLLTGSALATLTMILHPLGGNLKEIAQTKHIMEFSHSLAIVCIPFLAFGFWGLASALTTKSRLSFLAFCMVFFGLIAAMIAGTINGLVLPRFASSYWNSNIDATVSAAITNYGRFINLAMDYIFIVATSLSILIWSIVVVTTGHLSKWLGYYGMLVVTAIGTGLLLKLNFTSVAGFSVFIFGIVSWKILAGILLLTRRLPPVPHRK